jgi:hypothetical protein
MLGSFQVWFRQQPCHLTKWIFPELEDEDLYVSSVACSSEPVIGLDCLEIR